MFLSVGPDSERCYAEIESEFGKDRLEDLYELLAAFYTTLGPQSAGARLRTAAQVCCID